MRARSPSAGRDWAAAVAGVCAERMRVLSRAVRVNLARTPTISPNLQRSPALLARHRQTHEAIACSRWLIMNSFAWVPTLYPRMWFFGCSLWPQRRFQPSPAGDLGGGFVNLGGAAISHKLATFDRIGSIGV